MESYEELLKDAYKKVKIVSFSSERFEIPKVQGKVEGKNTVITNIKEIAECLRRPIEHISKFLMKELATSGKVESEKLILNTKLNSLKVNEKVQAYAKEFVICPVCGKPDTEISAEKDIKYLKCLACGAKSPVRR